MLCSFCGVFKKESDNKRQIKEKQGTYEETMSKQKQEEDRAQEEEARQKRQMETAKRSKRAYDFLMGVSPRDIHYQYKMTQNLLTQEDKDKIIEHFGSKGIFIPKYPKSKLNI